MRVFLVFIDETDEARSALRFAARRAAAVDGGVHILALVPQQNISAFGGVQDTIEQEARDRAEMLAHGAAGSLLAEGGIMPSISVVVGGGQKVIRDFLEEHDEVAALVFLIENPLAKGPYNLVGPQPARSVDVTKELARQMGRPHWLGLPSIAISLLMGEAGKELLLTSQQINPVALERSGFTFTDQSLESAISQIV